MSYFPEIDEKSADRPRMNVREQYVERIKETPLPSNQSYPCL